VLFSAFIGNQSRQNICSDVLLLFGQRAIGSTALDCSQPVLECVGIAWWSALSLLAGHNIA
jgi:hypothetical protein